jgi:hypothetical protein
MKPDMNVTKLALKVAPQKPPASGRFSGSGLTQQQKRLLVRRRFAKPDAASRSDRAIARELGVSQPFVSALRFKGGWPRAVRYQCLPLKKRGNIAACPEAFAAVRYQPPLRKALAPQPTGDLDVLGVEDLAVVESERVTGSHEALDRFHDEHSPLGRVSRSRFVEDGVGAVLHDFDPFLE